MQTETLPPISIFQAFTKWINQRPGLEPRNYYDPFDLQSGRKHQYRDGLRAYRQEVASIGRDRKRAIAALGEAMGYEYNPGQRFRNMRTIWSAFC